MASLYNDPLGYYAELDARFDTDFKIIKQNYRYIAKKWHPDYNNTPEALEKFQKISVAYDILQNEKTKLMYDLLSQVYTKSNFPDMFSLKIYKNQKDQEDINIRALVLRHRGKDVKEIANYKEAQLLVFKNFLTNFWNIKDVIYNFKNMGQNDQENLTLLIHNAFAYEAEGKTNEAYASAYQALDYANDYQKGLLNIFMAKLKVSPKIKKQVWDFRLLRLIEISIPLLIFAALCLPLVSKLVPEKQIDDSKEINYYQEVRFRSGGETVDDVVVTKILSFPVDVTDYNMLYHTTHKVPVMYGPSAEFDVITKLEKNHTVRVTGVSPDKIWFRVMMDNGDMGFIPTKYLEKGFGNKPPENSKIFKENQFLSK